MFPDQIAPARAAQLGSTLSYQRGPQIILADNKNIPHLLRLVLYGFNPLLHNNAL